MEERVNKRERETFSPSCLDKKEEKSFFLEERISEKEKEEDFFGRKAEREGFCLNERERETGEWRSFLEGREGRNVAGIVGRSEG